MERDAANLSTEHQPKGGGRNLSDTLDKLAPDTASRAGDDDLSDASVTGSSPAKPGTAPVVDEKGRPPSGEGLIADKDG